MPCIYIVFDQLPKQKDGGLVATYINFVKQFKNDLDINLVSIFDNGGNDIKEFDDVEIINLSNYVLDNRFFHAFAYLKEKDFQRFFHALASGVHFFSFIPFSRYKTKKLLSNSMVISVSPAASMFISNQVTFIQEIHTSFEYFWGDSIVGRLQTMLAATPALTLFRNKADAQKAADFFPATYIYNGTEDFLSLKKKNNRRRPNSALYVGALVEYKNPFLLLHCAKRVQKIIPSFTLDIYGVGILENALLKEIDRLKLNDVVTLKGFTKDKTIYSNYEQFWFGSNLEGFGLVLVEAMANKTPVITTNWGEAVSEIIHNGETGYIVNNEDEFVSRAIELFNNSEKSNAISEAAYSDFRKRFSVEQNKESWEQILSSVYPETYHSSK